MASKLGSIKEQKSRAPTKAEWAARIKRANQLAKKKSSPEGVKAVNDAAKKTWIYFLWWEENY